MTEQYQLATEINSLFYSSELECKVCNRKLKANKDKAEHVAKHWANRIIPEDWQNYVNIK